MCQVTGCTILAELGWCGGEPVADFITNKVTFSSLPIVLQFMELTIILPNIHAVLSTRGCLAVFITVNLSILLCSIPGSEMDTNGSSSWFRYACPLVV